MNYFLSHSRARAFSLVELLVIVAIISTVSVIILVSVNDHRTRKEVEGAAFIVAGKIREAQVSALTGRQYTPGTTPCGYRATWSGGQITTSYVSRDSSDVCTVATTMSTQTLSGGVSFADSGSVEFVLPHGKIVSNQVISLSKDGVSYAVCVSTDGLIEAQESTDSC